jgi:hypothetical protein
MTHKNGFMSDLSTEAQSRRSKLASRHRDSETMRKASLKSPWRNGPTVKSRNAHDAFAKNVTGDAHGLRSNK